jgi:hypothetical protein
MYHVVVDGRNTAASALPSASKSPTTGTSPFVPNGKEKYDPSSERRTNHSPVEDARSRCQFTVTGEITGTILSVVAPNCPAIVTPFELRLIHHSATDGRKIAYDPSFHRHRAVKMAVPPASDA